MQLSPTFTKFQSLEYYPELIYMMTGGMKKGIPAGNFLGFTLFCTVMYNYIPMTLLLFWFIAQSIVMMTRIWLAKQLELYTQENDRLKTRFLKYYIFSLFVTAFFWGLTSWLTLIYAPVLFSFFTLALLLTLSGGATLPLGSVFHAFFAYTVTILLMLSSSFVYYYGGEVHSIIAFLTIVAMIILVLNGYTYFLKIKRMVELSMELKEFNRALEERVKSEVAKNIEKDVQLMHQARLAQVGEMVSMIAHQWRQPLHIISTAATEMDLKIHFDTIDYSACQKNLGTINTMTQHLSATIDDFRDFFRMTREKERTSLEEVVTATLRIVKEHIENTNITLYTDLQNSEPFYSYPNELKQVLLNLLKNAEDALMERGVANPQIKIHTFGDEMNIFLEVCDNGGGIPMAMTNRIFDAYFSSKPHNKGTGLGLYMSKTIIEEHCGGVLSVRNDKEGACFRISLPKI